MRNLLAIVALLALLTTGRAAEVYWSSGSTAIATNLAWAATPLGAKTIDYVNAYGYNNGTLSLKFWDATSLFTVTNALAASVGSNILCEIAGSSLSNGDPILIADLSAGTYQRAWVHATNSAGIVITNIYQATDLSTLTLASGDRVYALTARGTQKVPNNSALNIGGNGGLVWATSSGTYPTVVEAVCDQTTLLTNTWVIMSGRK